MKPIQTTIFVIALLFATLTTRQAQAQESNLEFEVLKEELNNEVTKLNEPFLAFQKRYIERLDDLKKKAQAAGDLDQILAIDKEIEMVPNGGSTVPKKHAGLVAARKIYDTHLTELGKKRSGAFRKILLGHRAKLSALQTKLTKSGAIQEAIKIKQEITSVDAKLKSNLALTPPVVRQQAAAKNYTQASSSFLDSSATDPQRNSPKNKRLKNSLKSPQLEIIGWHSRLKQK